MRGRINKTVIRVKQEVSCPGKEITWGLQGVNSSASSPKYPAKKKAK